MQDVIDVIRHLQGFYEAVVIVFLHGFRSKFFSPFSEQTGVFAEHPETSVFRFFIFFRGRRGRPLGRVSGFPDLILIIDFERISQLNRGLFLGKPEDTCCKVDRVSVSLTAKAVEPLIDLHTGILIIVKRTGYHSGAIDLEPESFSSPSCRNRVTYRFKHVHIDDFFLYDF